MPRRHNSALYPFLLLALVASVALLAFSSAGHVSAYLRETASIETRHGLLADRPLSIAVASAPNSAIARVPARRYLERASAALVVFEGEPRLVHVGGRAADLVWLDAGLKVRHLDEGVAMDGEVAAPLRTSFLLVLPQGFVARTGLQRGERLQLL